MPTEMIPEESERQARYPQFNPVLPPALKKSQRHMSDAQFSLKNYRAELAAVGLNPKDGLGAELFGVAEKQAPLVDEFSKKIHRINANQHLTPLGRQDERLGHKKDFTIEIKEPHTALDLPGRIAGNKKHLAEQRARLHAAHYADPVVMAIKDGEIRAEVAKRYPNERRCGVYILHLAKGGTLRDDAILYAVFDSTFTMIPEDMEEIIMATWDQRRFPEVIRIIDRLKLAVTASERFTGRMLRLLDEPGI